MLVYLRFSPSFSVGSLWLLRGDGLTACSGGIPAYVGNPNALGFVGCHVNAKSRDGCQFVEWQLNMEGFLNPFSCLNREVNGCFRMLDCFPEIFDAMDIQSVYMCNNVTSL